MHRFVAQTPALLADGLHYEQRIAERGAIATRERNWHDLLNALVWMRYPAIKQALNRRQMTEIARMGPKQRSRAQYAMTHFDEAGVIVRCAIRPCWRYGMRTTGTACSGASATPGWMAHRAGGVRARPAGTRPDAGQTAGGQGAGVRRRTGRCRARRCASLRRADRSRALLNDPLELAPAAAVRHSRLARRQRRRGLPPHDGLLPAAPRRARTIPAPPWVRLRHEAHGRATGQRQGCSTCLRSAIALAAASTTEPGMRMR